MYAPAALQLPAEEQETEKSLAFAFGVAASAGSAASTPVAHLPALSVSSNAWWLPELSS